MTKQINKNSGFLLQGAILAAAAVIAKIIGAAYKIPLTNILGDEGMGFYGYAFEVYAIALILSSFSPALAVSSLCLHVWQKRNIKMRWRFLKDLFYLQSV